MDVSVNNLTQVYNGQTLFNNLSFQIDAGLKICVAGPSGSGKSTLLKALMGLVVPTSGTILIDNETLTERTVWYLRTRIAYVAQEPDLGTGISIDCIRRPFDYRTNAHLKWDLRILADYCRRFRLAESLLYKDVGELSGGEKQRIALIMALLLQRPVLILDEPVSALDKQLKAIVRDELLSDDSRTILFVSHESTLLDIADDTIDLYHSQGAGQ